MNYMVAKAIMNQRLEEAHSRRLRAVLSPSKGALRHRVNAFRAEIASSFKRRAEIPEPAIAVTDCCVA